MIARKIAEISSSNRDTQHFYAACSFDELSRGFVLCLLIASFGNCASQVMPQLDFIAEIDDHGVRRGDRGQILARWHCPMASRLALLDLLCQAMHDVSHRHTAMAAKMTSEGGVFFAISDLCLE